MYMTAELSPCSRQAVDILTPLQRACKGSSTIIRRQRRETGVFLASVQIQRGVSLAESFRAWCFVQHKTPAGENSDCDSAWRQWACVRRQPNYNGVNLAKVAKIRCFSFRRAVLSSV